MKRSMRAGLDFTLTPLGPCFGALITDIDLTGLDAPTFTRLYDAWLEYALLIFPAQHLRPEDQIRFARRFGELEFDIAPLSNVREDGRLRPDDDSDDMVKVLRGNMGWHADSTYMPLQAKGAVFSARVVPSSGGETEWADMRAAHAALGDDLRERIVPLSAHHSLRHSQAKLGHVQESAQDSKDAGGRPARKSEYSGYGFHDEPPPLRPIVKVHPETGRPSILIGRHAYGIPGLTTDASERLLDELLELACQSPRIHRHHWRPGDVVLWDNRCLLHRGLPWDMNEPRVMLHSRIAGDPRSEGGIELPA